jgi:hypothetical protein
LPQTRLTSRPAGCRTDAHFSVRSSCFVPVVLGFVLPGSGINGISGLQDHRLRRKLGDAGTGDEVLLKKFLPSVQVRLRFGC